MDNYNQPDNYTEFENPPKRLLSAPTLYGIFVFGVVLIGVGTFMTASAYLNESEEKPNLTAVLKILGPIILCVGGACMLGMTLLCVFAYAKNKRIIQIVPEDMLSIGQSTFYGDQTLMRGGGYYENLVEENNPISIISSNDNDPMKYLAETVLNERIRKLSMKTSPSIMKIDSKNDSIRKSSVQFETNYYPNPSRNIQAENLSVQSNNIERPSLRRSPGCVELVDELHCEEDYFNPTDDTVIARERSQTIVGQRKPSVRFRVTPDLLRRNVTLSTSEGQGHLSELRRRELKRRQIIENKNREMNYPPELQYNVVEPYMSLKKNRSQRKSNKQKEAIPEIHHLPSFSSTNVINTMIDLADKKQFRRSVSFDSLQYAFPVPSEEKPFEIPQQLQLLQPSGNKSESSPTNFTTFQSLTDESKAHRIFKSQKSLELNIRPPNIRTDPIVIPKIDITNPSEESLHKPSQSSRRNSSVDSRKFSQIKSKSSKKIRRTKRSRNSIVDSRKSKAPLENSSSVSDCSVDH